MINIRRILTTAFLAAFAFILFLQPVSAKDLSAEEIAGKMDQKLRGKTSYSDAEMEIINPRWRRTLKMKTWSRGTEYFFIHILAPPREEDTTFLKKNDLLYQYLPSAEMRIKITPSMMLQSWMGSDFTNDDLVKESSYVDDYTHKLLRREKLRGREVYVVESIPKPDAPVVWGKLMVWIDTEMFLPLKEEFYDEKGNKKKVLKFFDFKKANDRMYPSRWEMTPLNKKGHKTIYRINEIEFNKPISDRVFTLRNLEKPR